MSSESDRALDIALDRAIEAARRIPNVPKYAADYAAKFGVNLTVSKHGIYGDEWDWEAKPSRPTRYPTVGYALAPVGTDPRAVVRIVAERMGTGRNGPTGFCVVRQHLPAQA